MSALSRSHHVRSRIWLVLSTVSLVIVFSLILIGAITRYAEASGTITSCDEAHLNTALSTGGSISFNCSGTHQPATIFLTAQKTITLSTSIDGGGIITLSGGGSTRLFSVTLGSDLSLSNLTIADGKVNSGSGGAIANNGALIASNVLFLNNIVTGSGSFAGGAILSAGALTLTNNRLVSNTASWRGGAIYVPENSGSVYITGSTFYSNTSSQSFGGAIDNDGADSVVIINSVFHDNRSLSGGSGAIDNEGVGPLIIRDSQFYNNTAHTCCGAIFALNDFTMTNSSVIGNQAVTDWGGGLVVDGATYIESSIIASNTSQNSGGGLLACCAALPLVISDTTFYSNTTGKYGGALDNEGADPLIVINSVFHDNVGTLSSGAIEFAAGMTASLRIDHSRFYNNVALANCCGAIDAYGVLTLTNSSIYNNVTYGFDADGGGLYMIGTSVLSNVAIYSNHADRSGGGIYSAGSTPQIFNTTIASNTAGYGAGLYVNNVGDITLTNVTLANNVAITSGGNINGAASMVNTIFSQGVPNNCNTHLNSLGHNLETGTGCGLVAIGDLTNTSALLWPLSDYGGSTQSMPPSYRSPAIDAGDNLVCPATDQRGVPRPIDGDNNLSPRCDIGAVEVYPYNVVYLPLVLKNF